MISKDSRGRYRRARGASGKAARATRTPREAGGWCLPGFEGVVDAFEQNLAEHGDFGAAFAAVEDGVPVVDIWGGLASRHPERAWQCDTVASIFSGTKGFVATCLLILIERAQLDLNSPVWRYWPEFASEGKTGILVRHVVAHQAGLPGLTTPVTIQQATDGRRMADLLARQPAICPPGEQVYYHALTFGWLCGELIRRVDGRNIGRFFSDEIAAPLALDAWIGLPVQHEHRVAVVERGPGFGTQPRDLEASSRHDLLAWSIWDNPARFSVDELPANTREWRAAQVPASNGVATARAVARLYGCLARGGELDGIRLLQPESINLGHTAISAGIEPYLNEPVTYGIGFELQSSARPFGAPPLAFGHRGAGGSVHGAWPQLNAGFSYVTSDLRHSADRDPRAANLMQALHQALTRPPPRRPAPTVR